jgi:hypothetical protein
LDTTKVILPTKVARLAFQDLLRYDGAKLEIVELNNVIVLKDQQINLFKQKANLINNNNKAMKINNKLVLIKEKLKEINLVHKIILRKLREIYMNCK